MDNNRNFLLAAVLSLAVVFLWQLFIIQPRMEREEAIRKVEQERQVAAGETAAPKAGDGSVAIPTAPSSGATAVPGAAPAAEQGSKVARVPLKSGKLEGSISLRGARIDDLRLLLYRETVDPTSPTIRLLMPSANENGYFAEFGWSPDEALGQLPGPATVWRLASGSELTPDSPVALEYENEKGLTFRRTIEIDENYMFTVSDTVANGGSGAVSLKPYGRIARFGTPETAGIYVLHEGMLGAIDEEGHEEIGYDDIQEEKRISKPRAEKGWVGITDKYWATALIPGAAFTANYNYFDQGRAFYQTDYLGDPVNVAPGGEVQVTSRLFAGAKKVGVIDGYEADLGIVKFNKLIDWGWFYWLTQPLFQFMDWVFGLVGNFGVAILIVTVCIKLIFLPLANKSYASMANMKKVQPEMTAIRERFADDRQAQQKAMMELYKKEKINPAAGCWPVLIQIPVFFALYKVIYVTIEMRHAPFFGWIQDLSAADPTSIFNLFGLLPFGVPAFLAIGVWPLLMGITMFVQMQMNPAPPDPTQQMIFKWMPVVFTFMLATFPAGLVIYWAWNNFLSILQQGFIMKRQGAKIELWDNLRGLFGKKGEQKT